MDAEARVCLSHFHFFLLGCRLRNFAVQRPQCLCRAGTVRDRSESFRSLPFGYRIFLVSFSLPRGPFFLVVLFSSHVFYLARMFFHLSGTVLIYLFTRSVVSIIASGHRSAFSSVSFRLVRKWPARYIIEMWSVKEGVGVIFTRHRSRHPIRRNVQVHNLTH